MPRITKADVDWTTKSELSNRFVVHADKTWSPNPVIFHIATHSVELEKGTGLGVMGNVWVTDCGKPFGAVEWSTCRNEEYILRADKEGEEDRLCPRCFGGEVQEYLNVIRILKERDEADLQNRELERELHKKYYTEVRDDARNALKDFVDRMYLSGFVGDVLERVYYDEEEDTYVILSGGAHRFHLKLAEIMPTGESFSRHASRRAEEEMSRNTALVERDS